MTRFEIARDLGTLALALFGAGLSVFNYIDAKRKDRRKVAATMGTSTPVYGSQLGSSFVCLTATNTGFRAVTLTHLGLELENGSRLASLELDPMPGVEDSRFPVALADGQQAKVHFAYADVGQGLINSGRTKSVKIIAVAEDTYGKRHVGQSWTIDPSEWLRL